MIGAVFAASGVTEARTRLVAMMGTCTEVVATDRGVIGAAGVLFRRDLETNLVVEGTDMLPPSGVDGARVASAGLVCALGLRDDGLLLARGRFGGRALYFASDDRGEILLACTSLEAIARAQRVKRIRRERLASLLLLLPDEDPEQTVYEGIHRLRSATESVLRVRGRRETRSFAFPAIGQVLPGTAEEHAGELRRQLFTAVARALGPSKRVAIAVSGGLDSSGVLAAAIAAARGASPIAVDAITLYFAGVGDDRPHADALCSELGIVPIRVAPKQCASRVRSSLVLDGGPCVIPPAAWVLELCARARDLGADRVLTGEGGDLVVEGDLARFADQAFRGDWLGAVRGAADLRLIAPSSPARRVASLVVRPLARRALPSAVRLRWRVRAAFKRTPWTPPSLEPWIAHATRRQIAREGITTGPHTDASWIENEGADRLLEFADARAQFESTGALPIYTPFLDPQFVDHVRRIPPGLLFHGGLSRGLYREALRGRVAEVVRLRKTKGTFAAAVREMLDEGGASHAVADLLDFRALSSLGLVDPISYAAHFRAATTQGVSRWVELWAPLAIEAFLRRANQGAART